LPIVGVLGETAANDSAFSYASENA